jgi:hypothetical protein
MKAVFNVTITERGGVWRLLIEAYTPQMTTTFVSVVERGYALDLCQQGAVFIDCN